MSREDPQMKIRLPADLKDQIEAAAKDSGRSMNAEIVVRLQDSFAGAAIPNPESFGHSTLAKFAGRLHDLQGKRNTLALVLHALNNSGADAQEVFRVQHELEVLDLAIAKVLVSIQEKRSAA